jgi:hypothetical protein
MYSTTPATPNKNYLISQLKNRLTPYRYEHTKRNENDQEKNRGFILIDQVDGDLVLIPNDNTDQQHTRHAEPCKHGQIDDDTVNIDQIQLESTTPVTPHLLPPPQSSSSSLASSILPVINRK